ncbi:MAG: GNAT family N-acetyltransferase [Acidimicrobiia bacterium]|nr:GNAT family N-acetyltransferase [Acidimicrobiia bacterium]
MSSIVRLETAHTADLGPVQLRLARELLDDVFTGEMTDEDWDHCLGGIHCLVWEGEALIGHAAVVQRQLIHDERTLRCGYVEGVVMRADRRRSGHGSTMMEQLERAIRNAYDLGALGATDDEAALYTRRGWQKWLGPTSTLTPTGTVRTPNEDGFIYVLPGSAPLDVNRSLICDWRNGEVW